MTESKFALLRNVAPEVTFPEGPIDFDGKTVSWDDRFGDEPIDLIGFVDETLTLARVA